MSRPTLSIVLCTYNGEAFLGEQLDSLLAQTQPPDEIVIGDDASTDATRDMLRAFARDAGARGIDVRLIERPRTLGFVGNFSASLREARADIIFLCDQDDVWHERKLAAVCARFEADPVLSLLCSNARLVDAAGDDLGVCAFDALELTRAELEAIHHGRAFDVLLRRSAMTGATMALRRTLVARVLPVGDGWIHDEWLALVAAATGKVDAIEEPLIDYRQHGANQVGMRRRNWSDRWQDLLRPRDDQFRDEVGRMQALQSHLRALDTQVAEAALRKAARRCEHFAARLALGPLPRWRRVPEMCRQAARGDYRRYGTGVRSMLRDLLRHE